MPCDLSDVWSDDTFREQPSASSGANTAIDVSARAARHVVEPAPTPSTDDLVIDELRRIRESTERRDMMLIIVTVLTVGVVIHHIDRLNYRIRSLEHRLERR